MEHVIVVMWNGRDASDALVAKIGEMMIANRTCIPELLTIKSFNEDEIAKAIAEKAITVDMPREVVDPVKAAFEYISKRFTAQLASTPAFAVQIANAIADVNIRKAMGRPVLEDQLALINAIEILQHADDSAWKIGRLYHIGTAAKQVICSLRID